MSARNDGGPAFPLQGFHVKPDNDRDYVVPGQSGMSLRAYAAIKLRVPDSGIDWLDDMIRQAKRDEFAGQALAGLAAESTLSEANAYRVEHATAAYALADAMLKAREVGHG